MNNKFAILIIVIGLAAFLFINSALTRVERLGCLPDNDLNSAFFIGEDMSTGVWKRPLKFCSIKGCNNKQVYPSKGLCRKHYRRKYCLKYDKQYYQDNRKDKLEYAKQYTQTLKGKTVRKASYHNRRLLTKDLTREIVRRVYEANVKKYGVLTCYLCFKPIVNNDDSLDHSTPLTRDGTNDYENLGIAHLVCNLQKGTKTLKEFSMI